MQKLLLFIIILLFTSCAKESKADSPIIAKVENMILTVEPGIYIPEGSKCDKKWWGIAVRIEDDILVTKNGPINFSALAPRKSEEIEKMMEQESIFDNFQLPNLDEGQ